MVLDSVSLASEELKSGALIPLFPELEGIRFRAYWLVYPNLSLRRRAVQLFRDWLLAEVQRFEDTFAEFKVS